MFLLLCVPEARAAPRSEQDGSELEGLTRSQAIVLSHGMHAQKSKDAAEKHK